MSRSAPRTAPQVRPLGPDDADALLALAHARDLAVLGRTDTSEQDVRVDLADPDLDPGSVAVEVGGRLAGATRVWFDASTGHVDVDVVAHPQAPPALLDDLLERVRRTAVDGGRARGCAELALDHHAYEGDLALRAALQRAGYAPATAYHRMRRELDAPVERVRPDGVVVRRAQQPPTPDELRLAHALHQESFAGHFGFAPRSVEDWSAAWAARDDRGAVWFARVDGVDAGFLQETEELVEELDAGYVLRLGVLPPARGRGAARALLTASFRGMQRRGRRAAVLHVDVANATGALGLYESVGMRPVLRIDAWRLVLPLG